MARAENTERALARSSCGEATALLPRADVPDQVRIGHKLLISGVEGCRLDDRLSHEKAVERIPVQQRQAADEGGRVRANGQFAKPRVDRRSGDFGWVENKPGAAKSGFDDDLPNAGGAEQHLGVAAFNRAARLRVQPARLTKSPQQNMRVEKHTH